MKKKVIIIGAGVSGLSLAARLLSKGFNVAVYEKNLSIGGTTNLYVNGDFKFDLTATISMFIRDYIDVFNYCKKDYSKYFSIIPVKPLYRVHYFDHTCYDFSNDLASLSATLSKVTGNDIEDISGYFDFVSQNYKKFLYAEKNLFNKGFEKTSTILNPKNIKSILHLNPVDTCFKECSKYITNKKLIDYILFQTMYIGISPFSASSMYNLIPATTQLKGLYYIKGGMYSYTKALERLILEQGGIIKTSSPVDKIIFRENRAVGITVNNKDIYADNIVCSLDYTYAINNLIRDEKIKELIKPTKKYKYSCSTFILYLALDKKYPTLKLHNIYINKYFRKNIKATFKGTLPNNPSLYIYCPSSIDDSICPKGLEAVNIIIRVPNLLFTKISWNRDNVMEMKKQILAILSSIKGLEDIKSHIIFDNFLTPLDLRDRFNSYAGAAFGISHTLKQTGPLRPQCQIPKVFNLYFTGNSLHPGNGVSTVLKSAKICCDSIIEKYN
ncbi:MAG: phytoene desaturase family protein [Clostridiaceae bacterium]|nr:phytoene desaturase family protein [Clostridiaceae bacterium]